MPIYEYQCLQCGRRSEHMQKMADPLLTTCEVCGGELKKLISSPAVQFKGSGWYVTDYAKSGSSGSPGSSSKNGKSESSTASPAPAPAKSDTTSASTSSTATKA
jgi:putative FmdB family regulatory protein